MACAKYTGTTNETKDIRNSKLFLLVVTKDRGAVKALKRVKRLDRSVLSSTICFQTCGTLKSTGICDCWFALEYFEFLQDGTVDQPILDHVIANIDRGQCIHVASGEQYELYTAATTLLNAAVAAGNKPVLKYLTKNGYTKPHFKFSVQPIHLAIMKSQKKILHFFKDVHKFRGMTKPKLKLIDFPFNEPAQIVRRDIGTGKLVSVNCLRLEIPSIVCLLSEYDIKDKALIECALSVAIRCYNVQRCKEPTGCQYERDRQKRYLDIRNTFLYLLLNKRSDIALVTLKLDDTMKLLKRERNIALAFACVLLDEDMFLKELLKREAKLLKGRVTTVDFKYHDYGMLDLALAFESERCASVLQKFTKSVVGVQQEISPYCVIIETIRYHGCSSQLACNLIRRCVDNGYNINATGEPGGYTPMQMAIQYEEPSHVISTLLENGSDIDTTSRDGHTPLQKVLNGFYVCRRYYQFHVSKIWWYRSILPTLLYYNPAPDVTGKTIRIAMHYDATVATTNIASSDDVITVKSDDLDTANNVLAMTPKDRLLCLSLVATLYELGFSGRNIELELQQILSTENVHYLTSPTDYMTRLYSMCMTMVTQPRSLKSCCRIAIRTAFPGTRLHKHLANSMYPPVLRDYILRPPMLYLDR